MLPSFAEVDQIMDSCNENLVEQARVSIESGLSRQVDVARDDYANVRDSSLSGDDLPMRWVNVTASDKTANDNRADPEHKFLLDTVQIMGGKG